MDPSLSLKDVVFRKSVVKWIPVFQSVGFLINEYLLVVDNLTVSCANIYNCTNCTNITQFHRVFNINAIHKE